MRPGVEAFPVSLALIAVVYHFGIPSIYIWIPAMLAAFVFLGFFRYRRFGNPIRVVVILAVAAALAAAFSSEMIRYGKTARLDLPAGQYISLRGYLDRFPRIESLASRLLLNVYSVEYHHRLRRVSLRLELKVPGDLRHLNPGDHLEVDACVSPVEPSGGRGSYFMARRIHFYGRCKSGIQVRRIQTGSWIWALLGRWRNGFRAELERCFGDSVERVNLKGAFFEALLLGDRGHLSDSFRQELLDAGVFHLVAISGTHVAILALIVLMGMRWMGIRGWWRWGLTSGLLLVYLAVAGFPVSAVRAVIMVMILTLGRESGYAPDPLRALSLTGLAMLAMNPLAGLDAGFLMTFSLAAVIVLGRGLTRIFPEWVPRFFSELICATVNVTTVALPLSLYLFHRYAMVAPLSGMLLLPLCGPLLILGMLALCASIFFPLLSAWVLAAARIVVNILFAGISMASATGSTIYRLGPPIAALMLISVLLLLVHRGSGKRIRVGAAFLLLVVLVAASWRQPPHRPRKLEVHFLDVGQGDCACVVFPGGEALLIDGGGDRTGSFSVGRLRVFPYLLEHGIRVHWMALSHFHPDHAAGLLDLIPLIRPREIWISGAPCEDPLFQRLMGPDGPRVRVRRVVSGVVLERGKYRVVCLYPRRFRFSRAARNENSQILKVEDGERGFLFTGDAGEATEKELLGDGVPLKGIRVLKLGHHGSRTSSSPEFLAAVSPRLAVISRAASNPFGFPHAQVQDRLDACGIRWLDTAWSGTIRMVCGENGIQVETALGGALMVDFSPDIE